jgi:hypothetical protein
MNQLLIIIQLIGVLLKLPSKEKKVAQTRHYNVLKSLAQTHYAKLSKHIAIFNYSSKRMAFILTRLHNIIDR